MKNLFIPFIAVLIFFFPACNAQSVNKNVELTAIPHEISWVNYDHLTDWKTDGSSLSITGGKGSRLFVDPQQKIVVDAAPMALFLPDNEFLFSCKVEVDFKEVFDAGVLVVYADSSQWAKFCFEYSPQFKPMVVSVVNKVYSDDSNHDIIDKNEVYLRIAGLGGGAYALHYSLDGNYWNMVRYFHLDPANKLRIGFLSQSPRGESCKSRFSEIRYTTEKLEDIRGGK